MLQPDVPFLLLDGRQRTEGPGDDMKAYRLLSGSRAIPLLGKRAFPHRRLECSTHHPGVCVRPCRRVHLPAHRRHVDWALLKEHLMDDVFNEENESFMQETRLITNEYSVNLPTRFYYKKKWHDGWINVVLPQRGCIVVGSPGSGKSYCVINQFIKQQIEKGYALYCYDFKFPDLSLIVYNHLLKNKDKYKANVQFYVINFDDPRHSHRCNPINPTFMSDIADAYESAYVIMLNLNRTWV